MKVAMVGQKGKREMFGGIVTGLSDFSYIKDSAVVSCK